jgi:hypothetical protein
VTGADAEGGDLQALPRVIADFVMTVPRMVFGASRAR